MKISTPFRVWWIALFIKLILGSLVPLSFDESYYWVWSHHLQWSYFDHPGMVSWLFWLGHPLEPFGHAVRFPFVIVGHLVLLIWLKIFDFLSWSDRQKNIWLALVLSSPLLGLGSLLALPDTPFLFFSSLGILALVRALHQKRNLDFLMTGLCFGLAFCSKYHMVVVALALVLWLISSRSYRGISIWSWLLLLGAGLLACFPVFYWNAQNQWQSFTYQLYHGLGQRHWQPDWTLGYIGGEILVLFPVAVWCALKVKTSGLTRLLVFLAWTPLAFFLLSSFRGPVELNWPISAYPAVLALAVMGTNRLRWVWTSVLVWSCAAIFVLAHIFHPFLDNPTDKLNEVHYFDPVLPLAEKYQPLYLGTYQMASAFTYYYKEPFWKLFQISRHDLFDELRPVAPTETHYFVIKETWVPLPDWLTEDQWQVHRVQEVPPKFELLEVEHK